MPKVPAYAALAALAAALFSAVPAAHAQSGNGRWCAVVNIGKGGVAETCDFRTIEECRPFVIAGNRGFCNLNPRYVEVPVKHVRRHRRTN